MPKSKNLIISICLLLLAGLAWSAQAQSVVDSLEVRGLRFVAPQRVLLEFGVEKGDVLDSEQVAEGIQRLYRTGRFQTVDVGVEDLGEGIIMLILEVTEHPRLDKLRWEGLKKIDQKDLEEKIRLIEGAYLRPLLLSQAEKSIIEHCRDEGYHAASLETSREDDEGKVQLTFTLKEGKKSKIHELHFEGNVEISDERLEKAVSTKPKSFLNPLTWLNENSYQPDSLALDLDRLVDFYHQKGFLDARVLDMDEEFSENQERVTVTYRIEEGIRYRFGDIVWEGNQVISDSLVTLHFPFESGEDYDGRALEYARFNFGGEYHNLGYLYSQVKVDRSYRDDLVDLSLQIYEGPLARVREVIVVGNDKTLDKVIRREVRIFPGELFNREKVERSYRDIFMLRFFDDVRFEPRTDPSTGEVDLVYRVVERSSGQFGAGVTYSEATSFSGFIQLGTPNFLGRGQNVNLNWEFGSRVSSFNIQFVEPWFMDRPISLSGSIYNTRSNLYREYYEDRKAGFSVGVGRPLPWLDHTRVSMSYRLENLNIFNFTSEYLALGGSLAERDWPQIESSVTFLFRRNSTDSPFLPKRGSNFMLSSQFSGGILGGKLNFQKYDIKYTWYQKLLGPFVLRYHQTFGIVDGLDRPGQVPDHERFRLGGNRLLPLRGYDDYSVVPDGNSAFLGGRVMSTGTVELVLGIGNSVQIIAPFFDFGDTWNSLGQADFTTLHRSWGFGARVEVPMMGVLGFDWAYPMDPFYEGEGGRFHFKIGTDF
jgi:outer membrane protein insertion porin family